MNAPAEPPPLDRRALAERLRQEIIIHLDGVSRSAHITGDLLEMRLDENAQNMMRACIGYTKTAAKIFVMLREEKIKAAEAEGRDVIQ
jgi:hypothetical protein